MLLASLLPVLSSAINTIGAFRGTAAQARSNSTVQDAADIVRAVTPLVEQFASGTEVTLDQVRASLARKDAAIAEFDAELARQKAARGDGGDATG